VCNCINQLTPWSKVLLQKLIITKLVKKLCVIVCINQLTPWSKVLLQKLIITKLVKKLCVIVCINQLTPWSKVLLQKLIITKLVKKLPAFYGTRRFITVLTTARHLYLSWARRIKSTSSRNSSVRFILILSSHLLYTLLIELGHIPIWNGIIRCKFFTRWWN
jgi:hypothetical protein